MSRYVSDFRIGGLLGKGGMSVVYKALHPVTGEWVALKLFSPHPHLLTTPGAAECRRLFEREADILANLDHPNIVRVLDRGVHSDGRPFFTMTHHCRNLGMLIGESHRTETPSRPVDPETVIRHARQLLRGLEALHRAGVVHRDIKPYNLLLNDLDRVEICDFGLSRLRGETRGALWDGNRRVIVGSPFYAAPEQERDPALADARSDLHSAGIVIFRLLTGRLPERNPSPPSAARFGIDAIWDPFVLKAIERDPSRRFPSATSMLEALEGLARAWERRKESYCFPENQISNPSTSGAEPGQTGGFGVETPAFPPGIPYSSDERRRKLRAHPVKTAPRESTGIFQCDELGRPLGDLANDFELMHGNTTPEAPIGNHELPGLAVPGEASTVFDHATGLLWEFAGSPRALNHEEARQYVSDLNRIPFAGATDWRLPTVNELFSILKAPGVPNRHCLPDIFPSGGKRLWTCDRRSFTAAWYVDFETGFADWADGSCGFHVRAVRSAAFSSSTTV